MIPKDLTPYCPTDGDRQESPQPWTETNGCVPFAVTHACEIWMRLLNNVETDYSEQVLYQESNTSPVSGNSVPNVITALKKNGLVSLSVSPEPVNFTLAQWQTPIDPVKLATGKQWLDKYDVSIQSIAPSTAISRLGDGVILLTIDLNNGMNGLHDWHEVVLINNHQYFDSYSTLIKELDRNIGWADILTIKPKVMSQIKTQDYKGELRITLGASTPDQWAAICAVYGIDPNATPDETV